MTDDQATSNANCSQVPNPTTANEQQEVTEEVEVPHGNDDDDEAGALFKITTKGPTEASTNRSTINPSTNYASLLANLSILRMSDQKEVVFQQLWTKSLGGHDGPVLIILLRRFGCSLCQMMSMNFTALKPYLDAKNVKIIGIGCEETGYEEFVKGGYLRDAEIFLDKKRTSYSAVRATSYSMWSLWGFLGGGDLVRLSKISRKNGYSVNMKGDWNAMGGIFVIAPNGEKTLFSHLQDKTAMEPDMRKLMQSIGYTDKDMPKDLYPSHNLDLACLREDICGFI